MPKKGGFNRRHIEKQSRPMTHAEMEQRAEAEANARPKTNIDRITHYMEYGSAMNQLFLMSAMIKMVEAVLKDPEQTKLQMIANGSANMFHPESWIEAAREFKRQNEDLFR